LTVAFPIEDLLGLKPETGNMIHERHHHMTRGQAFKGVYGYMRGTIQKVHLLNALTVVATILKGTLTWLPPIKHVHGCRKQSVHGLEKGCQHQKHVYGCRKEIRGRQALQWSPLI